jgi:hyperosmotically inducible periplasmic protein
MKAKTLVFSLFFLFLWCILIEEATSSIQPDNTKINQRDESVLELTAQQQGLNKADVQITQEIRKRIVEDTSLSTYAHNIKVITKNGTVTLRGPVNSQGEKDKIEASAIRVAGVNSVSSEMQVMGSKPHPHVQGE